MIVKYQIPILEMFKSEINTQRSDILTFTFNSWIGALHRSHVSCAWSRLHASRAWNRLHISGMHLASVYIFPALGIDLYVSRDWHRLHFSALGIKFLGSCAWHRFKYFRTCYRFRQRNTRDTNPQLAAQHEQICCVTSCEFDEKRETKPHFVVQSWPTLYFSQVATNAFVAQQVDHALWERESSTKTKSQRYNVVRQIEGFCISYFAALFTRFPRLTSTTCFALLPSVTCFPRYP